ncbi:hypothetical protein EJ03DRAFT_118607 [Teratosphaeria nubilosa]|uniref:Uncharacterized protein n=1 Tax=Teratosphaeria nubilosa TaxID=161662 RepID=A0A6G1L642_9PEZI|nr:hypothetical protein EJ03DRAFT_118607 [Teratosphaeria nubilosa]
MGGCCRCLRARHKGICTTGASRTEHFACMSMLMQMPCVYEEMYRHRFTETDENECAVIIIIILLLLLLLLRSHHDCLLILPALLMHC